MIKRCSCCKQHKDLSSFWKNAWMKDGFCHECKDCIRQKRLSNPEKHHAYNKKRYAEIGRAEHLKKSYGLSEQDFEEMVRAQKRQCAICSRRVKLWVDHNHKTGKVRGLLCQKCNHGLGLFDDSLARMQKAETYLRKHA